MADIENPALGIENWHLERLFKALFTFGSILIHFRIFGFFSIFFILAYFPYVIWVVQIRLKWAKTIFFNYFSNDRYRSKNVFWVVRNVLQMCSPHFQTQNDDISWLAEKNIIYTTEYPNIGHQLRIAFQYVVYWGLKCDQGH